MPSHIAVVTTGRADYGLLKPLLNLLRNAAFCHAEILATGGHLSPAQGCTLRQIETDGYTIGARIEMNPPTDDPHGVCLAIAQGLAGFSTSFAHSRPDLLIVLGDRFELLAACSAAVMHRVPIAHIHGGEATLGALDDTIRHAVTKMSSLHFAALPQYAQRIRQMGEPPERVFTVGALGIDAIASHPFLERDQLNSALQLPWEKSPFLLFTYHPATQASVENTRQEIACVMDCLSGQPHPVLATLPNADAGSQAIRQALLGFAAAHPRQIVLKETLGAHYLDAMRHALCMVGNSSSGILEAASFSLPVVNIGDRQEGRIRPANVIDCPCQPQAIATALNQATSSLFRASLQNLVNPYGDGQSAQRIYQILSQSDLGNRDVLLKKAFHSYYSPSPFDQP